MPGLRWAVLAVCQMMIVACTAGIDPTTQHLLDQAGEVEQLVTEHVQMQEQHAAVENSLKSPGAQTETQTQVQKEEGEEQLRPSRGNITDISMPGEDYNEVVSRHLGACSPLFENVLKATDEKNGESAEALSAEAMGSLASLDNRNFNADAGAKVNSSMVYRMQVEDMVRGPKAASPTQIIERAQQKKQKAKKQAKLNKEANSMLTPKNNANASDNIAKVEDQKAQGDEDPQRRSSLLGEGVTLRATPTWTPINVLEKWIRLVYDKQYELEALQLATAYALDKQSEIEDIMDDVELEHAADESKQRSTPVASVLKEKLIRDNLAQQLEYGLRFDCSSNETYVSDDGILNNCTVTMCDARKEPYEGKDLSGSHSVLAAEWSWELARCCNHGAAENLQTGNFADGEPVTAELIREKEIYSAKQFKCPSLVLASECAKQIARKYALRRILVEKALRMQQENTLNGFQCSVLKADSWTKGLLGYMCRKRLKNKTIMCKGVHASVRRSVCRTTPELPRVEERVAAKYWPNYKDWSELVTHIEESSGLLSRPIVKQVVCDDLPDQPDATDSDGKPVALRPLASCKANKISVCRSDSGCKSSREEQERLMQF